MSFHCCFYNPYKTSLVYELVPAVLKPNSVGVCRSISLTCCTYSKANLFKKEESPPRRCCERSIEVISAAALVSRVFVLLFLSQCGLGRSTSCWRALSEHPVVVALQSRYFCLLIAVACSVPWLGSSTTTACIAVAC